MTVCKYFMQGNCRYGNKCYYEHPSGDNQGFAYTAQRQLFGGGRGGGGGGGEGGGGGGGNKYKWDRRQQTTQASPQSSPTDVINNLVSEIKAWEQSKMWPFSCIAFEKEGPCVPDFSDMSADELRFAAYEALKTGALQTYTNHVQCLSQEFTSKRQVLKNATMTVKQKMISLIEEYRNNKNRGSGGGSSTMSLFSKSNGSSGASGTSSTNSFGGGSGSSTFGGSDGNNQLFGGGTGAFSAPNAGAFGTNTAAQATGQIFGASTFGQSTATANNVFTAPQAQNTNPFGSSQQSSTFGGNTSGATFSSPGTFSSSFGKTSPAANLFGASSQSGPSISQTQQFGASTNTFGTTTGGNIVTAPSSDRQGDTTQDTVYTPLEKLSKEELAAYNATTFTLGKIPTKPPPKELVF